MSSSSSINLDICRFQTCYKGKMRAKRIAQNHELPNEFHQKIYVIMQDVSQTNQNLSYISNSLPVTPPQGHALPPMYIEHDLSAAVNPAFEVDDEDYTGTADAKHG